MAFVKVADELGESIELYHEDYGSGEPVVLIHGWPLSGRSWGNRTSSLVEAGHRVDTYDRRGFGRSFQPCGGYDYVVFTALVRGLQSRIPGILACQTASR